MTCIFGSYLYVRMLASIFIIPVSCTGNLMMLYLHLFSPIEVCWLQNGRRIGIYTLWTTRISSKSSCYSSASWGRWLDCEKLHCVLGSSNWCVTSVCVWSISLCQVPSHFLVMFQICICTYSDIGNLLLLSWCIFVIMNKQESVRLMISSILFMLMFLFTWVKWSCLVLSRNCKYHDGCIISM